MTEKIINPADAVPLKTVFGLTIYAILLAIQIRNKTIEAMMYAVMSKL